jgi:hypothetical protein
MPRRCSICSHTAHQEIDGQLVGGQPYRQIARRFTVTISALARHRESHLSPSLVALRAQVDEAESEQLVPLLRKLLNRTLAFLHSAERSKNAGQGLSAIREARACIELQARLTGKLDERPQITVNIMATEEWRQLREHLAVILRPFPEAWTAIADIELTEGA